MQMNAHLAGIRAAWILAVAAICLNGHEAAGQYAPAAQQQPTYANTAPVYQPPNQPGYAPSSPIYYTAAAPQYSAPTTTPVTSYPTTSYPTTAYPATSTPAASTPLTTSTAAPASVASSPVTSYPTYPTTSYPTTSHPTTSSYPTAAYPTTSSYPTSTYRTSPYPTASQPSMRIATNPQTKATTTKLADNSEALSAKSTSASSGSPYPTTDAETATSEPVAEDSDGGYGFTDFGISDYLGRSYRGRQWFCGIYALGMDRDEANNVRLGLAVDTAGPITDYSPSLGDTVLTADDADPEYRVGGEIRFGSTINCGGDCDYGDCCPAPCQTYAWELAYWYMPKDSQSAIVIDGDPTDATGRLFSGVNFSGLALPLDPENYVIPITVANSPPGAGDTRILAERVRTNFSAQNVELNIVRLPMIGYASACGCGGYAPPCNSGFQMAGLCGVRYLRMDDDFQFGLEFGDSTDTFDGFGSRNANELFYTVSTDNHLVGIQLGMNTSYTVGGCYDLFWDANFGFYNNHVNSTQRVFLGDGTTYITVDSDKDDFAFAGEMRLGGAYRVTCNDRITVAYRAVAVGGVALTTDQIPTTFDNPGYVGLIDSNGSVIIHGLQLGWERKF